MTRLTGNDLYHFHRCAHTLAMKARPTTFVLSFEAADPMVERFREWGCQHEEAYAEREGYVRMPSPAEVGRVGAATASLEAMRQGEPRIFQGYLQGDGFSGALDLLRRMDGESLLGSYHYEVGDIKSSLRPKSEQVLQVLFYSYLLERVQGKLPQHGFLVLADGSEWRFAIADYWDYFLSVLADAVAVSEGQQATEPVKIAACASCKWQPACMEILLAKDDLSLLPGVSRPLRREFHRAGIETIAQLAEAPEEVVAGKRFASGRRLQAQARATMTGKPISLAEVASLPRDAVFLTFETDFSRQNRLFLLAARSTGDQGPNVWFAESPEHFSAMLDEASEWLALRANLPWVVYEAGDRTMLRDLLAQMPSAPDVRSLSALLQEALALPVASYDLEEVAAFEQVQARDGLSLPSVLLYHLYLVEADAAIVEELRARAAWRLAAMAAIAGRLERVEEPLA